jgi:hypothetical protein
VPGHDAFKLSDGRPVFLAYETDTPLVPWLFTVIASPSPPTVVMTPESMASHPMGDPCRDRLRQGSFPEIRLVMIGHG